jgi:Na+/H+-dicarboxylate symporter
MKNIRLIGKITIAFFLAIVYGSFLPNYIYLVEPLGDLFLRLIKFTIVPLILTTLIVGVANSKSVQVLGRLGVKTLTYYLITTLTAICIAMILAIIIKPGYDVEIVTVEAEVVKPAVSSRIADILINIIPTNPFQAMVNGDVLQLIFFAIFIGISIIILDAKAKPVYQFFESFAHIMYKVTEIIMKFSPIGVFGLVTPIVGHYGMSILIPLIKVILTMTIASILHIIFTYSFAVKILGKMSPLNFLKGILPAGIVAFSTCSSVGTLPVTMRNTTENLGVSNTVASFVLPLGATINMDGAAIYQGIVVIFISQLYGIDLSFIDLVVVITTATLASIGSAGVPGSGLIMLSMVLTSVNLPLEGIALIAGIDRILDMFRTCVNVIGDASGCVVVDSKNLQLKNIETN